MPRLIDVRTQEKNRADAALLSLRKSLNLAEKALDAAKADAAVKAAVAGDLKQVHEKLLVELQAAVMPADKAAIVQAIEDTLRAQRAASWDVARATSAAAAAEIERDRLRARVDAAEAAAAAAARDLADAAQQDMLLTGWATGLAAPELAQAVADAGTAASDPRFKKAEDRLEKLLTAPMLAVYRRRATEAAEAGRESAARLADAVDSAAAAREANEPLVAARLHAAAALTRAMDAAEDVAESTVAALATAMARLDEVGARTAAQDPDAAVLARMAERKDKAEAAAAKEDDWFNGERDVREKRLAYQTKLLSVLDDDPDVDVDTDPLLDPERTDLGNAVKARDGFLQAFLDVKADLDTWEVAVPPELFADIVAFVDAEAAITRIKALDVDAAKTALADAESDYAEAEAAERAYRRGVATVDAELALLQQRFAASTAAAATAKLLVLRGDR